MNFTYTLYLITFLGYPIFLAILLLFVNFNKIIPYLKWVIIFFVSHNILYYLGFSIKGDYSDYIIFSLEYLFLIILIIVSFKMRKLYLSIIGSIGSAIILLGYIQGIIGILMFIVISQDFETDKVYKFENNGKLYQTRRYSFGFVTLDDITYKYETYREFEYLPFERLINKSNFSGIKDSLNFEDDNFQINIKTESNKKTLIFSSPDAEPYKVNLNN